MAIPLPRQTPEKAVSDRDRLVITHHAVSDATGKGKSPSSFGCAAAGMAWLLGLPMMLLLILYLMGLFLGHDVSNMPVPVPILVLSAPALTAAGYALLFYRKRIVLDASTGTLSLRQSMLFPVRTQTYRLQDFDCVAVRATCADRSQTAWSVRLCRGDGDDVELDVYKTSPAAKRFAQKVGKLASLRVATEALPEKQVRAERMADAIGLGIGAAILLVLALGFNVAFTWPVIKDIAFAFRYKPQDLEAVDCEIASMNIVRPERSPADTRPGVTISAGSRVEVSFRYSYGGQEYTGNKYSPIGDVALDGQEAYPPGHKTVCYVNPRYPDQAALVKESVGHSIAYPIFGNICFAIFFCALWGMAKSKKAFGTKRRRASEGKARSE